MMFVAQKTLTPLTVDSDTIEEFYQPYPFPTIDTDEQSTSIDTLVYSNGGTEGDWGNYGIVFLDQPLVIFLDGLVFTTVTIISTGI